MDVNVIRGKAVLSSSGNNYVGTLSVGDTAYVDGGIYLCRINTNNVITNPTINLNGIGARQVLRGDQTPLNINDFRANGWIALIYDLATTTMLLISGEFPQQGVDTTNIDAGGGAVTLIVGTNNPIQLITGNDTLGADWTFDFGGSPKDGDVFVFDYRATMVLNGHSITIGGLVLSDAQALAGNGWIESYYDSDAGVWNSKFILTGTAGTNLQTTQVFADKAARLAAVPDFDGQVGIQIDINAEFQASGTSAGNWDDAIPIGGVIYANSFSGHTLAQGATGARSNPFSTLAEARTAAVALSPSTTSRKIVDAIGVFNEQLILYNGLDWNLNNSIVELKAGALYTIDDNNVACDSIIYGNSQILRSTAGTLGCIRTQNASTNLRANFDLINNQIGAISILCTNGTQIINVKNNLTTNSLFKPLHCTAGSQTFNGNINTGTFNQCAGGTQIINGIITSLSNAGAYCTGGTQTINGNIVSATTFGIQCDVGGIQVMNGNIGAGTFNAAYCTGGTQTINNSRMSVSVNTDVISQTGGTQIIKDCTLITSGTGKAISDGSTVILNTPCGANKGLGTAITKGCTLTISSDIQ